MDQVISELSNQSIFLITSTLDNCKFLLYINTHENAFGDACYVTMSENDTTESTTPSKGFPVERHYNFC